MPGVFTLPLTFVPHGAVAISLRFIWPFREKKICSCFSRRWRWRDLVPRGLDPLMTSPTLNALLKRLGILHFECRLRRGFMVMDRVPPKRLAAALDGKPIAARSALPLARGNGKL